MGFSEKPEKTQKPTSGKSEKTVKKRPFLDPPPGTPQKPPRGCQKPCFSGFLMTLVFRRHTIGRQVTAARRVLAEHAPQTTMTND